MMNLLTIFGLLLAAATCEEAVVTCYYASYAIYRRTNAAPPGAVFPDDLASLTDVCTHLIYAFAGVNENTGEIKVLDPNADLAPEEGGQWDGFKKFTDLAKDTYSLKALIAVGGIGSKDAFSKIAADESLRGSFVNSAVAFVKKYSFDGLDMHWEFPESADDRSNFVSLLSELDQALHGEGLLLTVAVPIAKWRIDDAYDVPVMSSLVDLIHVMAYDYHGAWDKHLHHNAPLYKHHTDTDDTLNVDFSAHYWLEKGAPADKLVLGLPLYGRCWTLNDTSKHDILDLGSPSPPGPYSATQGFLFYNEICLSQLNHNDWVIVEDEEMKVPYGYSLSEGDIWCGYDDETSIANKATLSNNLGLRGIMLWTVDEDDAHNGCGSVSFPLTRKAKEVFNNPLTTPAPTTTVETSTAIITDLMCYSCFNCPTTDENTSIIHDPSFSTCFTTYLKTDMRNTHVVRGGEIGQHSDGECIDDNGTITCYCNSNLCNGVEVL